MKSLTDVLMSAFVREPDGYWSLKTDDGYELCVEPLLFDGQFYVALYKDFELIGEKLPVRAAK